MKSNDRTKQTGEVFTPTTLVLEMLEKLPPDSFEPEKTFLDNSCGNGQFLAEVFNKGVPLSNIYGVDLMADNAADTVARLAILEQYNIDIVSEKAELLVEHDGYVNDHNYHWLRENAKSFKRTYKHPEVEAVVTFSHWDKGYGGVLKVSLDGKPAKVNPNIVCQDALKYDYCFEGKKQEPKKNVIVF